MTYHVSDFSDAVAAASYHGAALAAAKRKAFDIAGNYHRCAANLYKSAAKVAPQRLAKEFRERAKEELALRDRVGTPQTFKGGRRVRRRTRKVRR